MIVLELGVVSVIVAVRTAILRYALTLSESTTDFSLIMEERPAAFIVINLRRKSWILINCRCRLEDYLRMIFHRFFLWCWIFILRFWRLRRELWFSGVLCKLAKAIRNRFHQFLKSNLLGILKAFEPTILKHILKYNNKLTGIISHRTF